MAEDEELQRVLALSLADHELSGQNEQDLAIALTLSQQLHEQEQQQLRDAQAATAFPTPAWGGAPAAASRPAVSHPSAASRPMASQPAAVQQRTSPRKAAQQRGL